MSIRVKTLLIIFLTFGSLLVLLYASSQFILLDTYLDLEATLVRRNLERARLALEKEVSNIETFVEDWANWDDSYEFVETANPDYVRLNLREGTYRTIPVHLITFFNTRGEIVYGNTYSPEEGFQPLSDELREAFGPGTTPFRETQQMRRVKGILITEDYLPIIFSALPVLTSLETGPVRGMVVFGRYLDNDLVSQLTELTQVNIRVYVRDDPAAPDDVQAFWLQENLQDMVHPVDDDTINGFTAIQDFYGTPMLVMKLTLSRSVYAQGIISIQYFASAIFLVGLVIGLTIMFLLEGTILRRIADVSQQLSAIGVSVDTRQRLPRQGVDEIGHLVEVVNKMLQRLDSSQKTIRESEERLQAVVSNAPILLFVLNEAGEFIFAEGLGLPQARDLIGRNAVEVFGLLPKAAASSSDFPAVTTARLNNRIYEMRTSVLAAGRDASVRTLGVATDVTELESARAAEYEQRILAEGLRDTAEALTSTLRLDEVMERISTSVGRVVPHDAAMIILIENGVATLVRSREDTAHRLSQLDARSRVEQIPWLKAVIETGVPINIGDLANYKDALLVPDGHWAHSFIAIPIYLDERVVGVLCLYHERDRAFSPAHVTHLQMFVSQAALAIRNARFYEAERKEREFAQILQKTAEILHASTDLETALAKTGRLFQFVVPHDQFNMILSEPLYEQLGGAEDSDPNSRLCLCCDFQLMCTTLGTQNLVVLENVQEHPVWRQAPCVTADTRSWVGIPIPLRNHTAGLITFSRNAHEPFATYDIQVMMAFAQQIILTVENMTILMELELRVKELREAQSQLVRMTRLSTAGEIAAGVAHQINNPLTTIVAETHLALHGMHSEDKNYESLTAIQEAARRAGTVVGRMLDLTRTMPYLMTSMDVNESLLNAIALVQAQIVPHVARLELDLAPDLPLISGSIQHLEDVWMNLLLNARDALTPEKQNVIRISTCYDPEKREIVVVVEDTGMGIDEHDMPQLFESFFTTKKHGTGLGLAISKEILEHHYGSIAIQSRKHEGTRVIVRFTLR